MLVQSQNSTLVAEEARCDVSARGFWSADQVAFLDIGCSIQVTRDLKTKALANPMKSTKRRRNELITKVFMKSSTIQLLR